jgi:alpha-beta hydrolase superfamily lysophospholipase
MNVFTRPMILLLASTTLASTACAVQVSESSLIRPVAAGAPDADAIVRAAPGATVEQHTITTADGTRLAGTLVRQPGARATILYFGGNQFTVGKLGLLAVKTFAPAGANLMLVDHRGYGQSEGGPTGQNLMTDGVTTFEYLAALPGIAETKIVVHGHSLGSFVAGHVAAARDLAGVVLESSITTTEDWIRARAGGIPTVVSPALRGQGNQRNMPRITEPLLLIVGEADGTTPPTLSQALYRQSPLSADRKTLAVIPGAGHNNVLATPAGQQAYQDFLQRVILGR